MVEKPKLTQAHGIRRP